MSESNKQTAKARSPWWAKVMVVVGAMVMLAAGGGAVATQVSVDLVNNAVNNEQLLPDQPAVEADAGSDLEGPLNFLVLGVDEQGDGRRSDTTIIVHVNAELDDVTIVSLPRDLLVDIETCDPACSTKLTSAFAGGDDRSDGFANSAQTVTDLTGVHWDGAMIANFEGFIDLVDELGTIELCPWHEITSIHGDRRTYPEGCAEYNQEEALDLVRQRYGWDWDSDWEEGRGGDYGRQKMQQQAIMGILNKAKELGYHKNPTKAVKLLNGFGEKLTVDLGGMQLADLIVAMREVDPARMTAIRTPSTTQEINGTSYVVIGEGTEHQTASEALWAALRSDTLDQWECQYPEYINSDSKPACATATETASADGGPSEPAAG
ncbi:LCP family protein [Glycomyces xiaoerkulensis]|uniref:LCP family protein n=1 Tax=Glycomyces xiaoerkulensis TaxID=2038139 RepID=UPI000C269DA5|nr:LCP family protein [Glycomyces xiaoerkulensis]